MIAFGVVCLIVGFILAASVLWTIGLVLTVLGLAFWVLGALDHAVFGRRHWF